MIKKDKKQPDLRFPGFTDDWEQRKLGEVAQCLDSERIPINAEEREKIPGKIPYYGAGNIQGYINKFLFDEELVLLLEDGDAFDDYRTKEIAQYICGKTWVNNHAHVLRPLGNAYFLYSILAHKDIRNWVQLAGASRKKLVQKSMLNIELIMPNLEEQQKIGSYFRELDHLITLHQRKCDQLELLKKGLMQKIFSQEVRFKADDGSEFPKWEKKELKTITEKVTRTDEKSNADIRMISQGNGFILQSDKYSKENAGQSLKKYTLLKRNEFAYNHGASKAKPYGVCYRLRESEEARVPYVYHTFRLIEGNIDFWNYVLNTPYIDRQLKRIVSSGARMDGLLNINYDAYMSIKINIPCLEEQKKIADCLSSMNQLIEKQKKTVSAWKELKKGLLQQMFV